MEAVTDFLFLHSKITADGDRSHEIRWLLLGRKAMANLDRVLENKDITLPRKVCIIKAMVFLVRMYRWESRTIKKAELWRTDAFKLWCGRRLLRVPWKVRRSNQSMLKEINPEYSLEGLMLKLATWCEQLTHWERPWWWETLKAEGEEGKRGWDGWMVSPIRWRWTWANSGRWWGTGKPGRLQSMGLQRIGHNLMTEQQQ